MKKSRFSEEQIIGILKEQQAGLPVAEICPPRHQRRDVLHVALALRRHGGLGCAASEGARRGEPQAQEAAGRGDARRGDAA